MDDLFLRCLIFNLIGFAGYPTKVAEGNKACTGNVPGLKEDGVEREYCSK